MVTKSKRSAEVDEQPTVNPNERTNAIEEEGMGEFEDNWEDEFEGQDEGIVIDAREDEDE